MTTRLHHIGINTSSIAKAVTKYNAGTFCHPFLLDIEDVGGCELGINYWADTCCSGKHTFSEEFIKGNTVTAMVFTSSLGSVSNLPIENVFYAYDALDVTVILLECNNPIYIGQKKSDSLLNPIQAEEVRVCVDKQPRQY